MNRFVELFFFLIFTFFDMMNLFSGSQKHEDVKTAMKRYCNKKKNIHFYVPYSDWQ